MEHSSPTTRIKDLSESNLLLYNKLLIVFKRSAKFLTNSDLVSILSLNHFFQSHLSTPEFLASTLFQFLSFVTNKPVSYENIFQVFEEFSGIKSNNIMHILSCLRNSRNLIQNPCGASKFKHWTVHNGGHDWIIEDWQVYKSMKTVFVSSCNWGSLIQKINLAGLIKTGKSYVLVAGSPVSRRWDCGARAEFYIKVNSKRGKAKEVFSKINDLRYDENDRWVVLKERVLVGIDDESVEIKFRGKDLNWWAGNYGARFGYCYAFLLENNEIFYEV